MKRLPLKKTYLLAALTVVLILLSIRLAFYKTWQARQINKALTVQLAQSTDVSYQPGYLERKNSNLNKTLGQYKVDTLTYQSTVLSALSALAEQEKVKIAELPVQREDPYYQAVHYNIQKLTLEGDYFALTKFLHKAELLSAVGRIRAASYQITRRAASSEKGSLQLQVYLEYSR